MTSLPRKVHFSWPTLVISQRKVHSSNQLIQSVMFGFPAKVSWTDIARLPRKVSIESTNSKRSKGFSNCCSIFQTLGVVTTPTPLAIYVPANKNKMSALPKGCVWDLQALKVLFKSLFETRE